MLNALQWWPLKGMGAKGAERMKQAIKGKKWWYDWAPDWGWWGDRGWWRHQKSLVFRKWNAQIGANPSWRVTPTAAAPTSSSESENVLQFYKHVISLKLHNGSSRWALSYSILPTKNLSPKRWTNSSSQLGSCKVKDVCCSAVSDSFATPWTVAYQAPLSMGFSRQESWSALSFPSPGDLPELGIEPTTSPALLVDSLPLSH